jgi:flagellar hook-associated protein 3 FlgL
MYLTSPNVSHYAQFSRGVSNLKAQLDRSSLEMVTGRRSDPLRAVRGDQETILRAQSALDQAEADSARLKVLGGRYQVASTTLRNVAELGQSVIGAALAAADGSSGTGAQRFAEAQARTSIGSALGALEARFGGRALFGGALGSGQVTQGFAALQAALDTALTGAVSAGDVRSAIEGVFAPGGAYETTIYLGEGQAADSELSPGKPLGSLPSASAEPIRQMLSGMSMALHVRDVPAPDREAFLQEAAGLMQAALEDIIAEEASLGLSIQSITREKTALSRRLFDAESTLEAVLGRDPFEAASETQSLEARLQAAYTVTGRLGALRLTNYLR